MRKKLGGGGYWTAAVYPFRSSPASRFSHLHWIVHTRGRFWPEGQSERIDRCQDAIFPLPAARQDIFYEGRPGTDQLPKAGQVLRMQLCGRLTTPPQDEVELVTNSAQQLLPEANTIESRARSATLDKFFLNRFLGKPIAFAGNACNAGRLLSPLNSPPVFAAHTSSAPGRFAPAS